jgi:septal ring factor EnvC (AmiA/AmiB activator)
MTDRLDEILDALDLEADTEDVQLDREQTKQLAAIKRLIQRQGAEQMADLTRLQAALDALGVDVSEVSAKIDDLKAQIAALSVGQITQEQIDALAAAAEAVDASLDASTAPDVPA